MEEQVHFTRGHYTLRGILHRPQSQMAFGKFPGIILCHGFTGNKIGQHRILVKAARSFCSAGFGVLRFDFSGCGDSDGQFADITLAGQVEEVLQAVRYVTKHPVFDQEQVYLVGLSMGGAVTALASAALKTALPQLKLAGLVLWAPVSRPYEDLRHIVGPDLFQLAEKTGKANFQGFELSKYFIQSLKPHNPVLAVRDFAAPVLIVQGTSDLLVPMEQAKLYLKSRSDNPKLATELQYVYHADHTFSSPEWEKELFTKTLDWLQKHPNKGSN